MMVNFTTEDSSVNQIVDLPSIPHEGLEIALSGVTYTVERVRLDMDLTEVWCLIEEGKPKKPKRPHPFK